ncbi:hypothetical protein BH10PSE14_BH10PSE14_31740 [soil metagenome]
MYSEQSVSRFQPDACDLDDSLAWLLDDPAQPKLRLRRSVLPVAREVRGRWYRVAAASLALFTAGSSWRPPSEQPVVTVPDARWAAAHAAKGPPHIDAPFAPEAMRPLTPTDAVAWNAALPSSAQPNPIAAAFLAPLASGTDYQRSLQCLTMAIYYEAGNEPDDGERAVAQVVLNRVRHVAYPGTVCGVVFDGAQRKAGCQFTFACDGAMARIPAPASWRRASLIATAALAGYVYAPVGLATHYHANYVVPYWASSLDKVATVGAHIFYRWNGAWGRGGAFTARYAGDEPALPFLSGSDALGATVGDTERAPVDVAAVDRPVLIGGVADPAVSKASRGRPSDKVPVAVEMGDRWIVPHDAGAGPSPGSTSEGRDVLMSQ